MEAIVGAELLHRTTRNVALSTAGGALYERSAPHLTALGSALIDLPERGEEPAGELRLTAPNDFGAMVLPELLSQFARRYPQISFDVRLANAKVDIVSEGFDVAIRTAHASMRDSSLTARRLGAANGDLYAAPAYIARRGKPSRLGDPGHAWIMHPHAMSILKVLRPAVRFRCDDFFLARDLGRDGAGIVLLPNFVAAPYVRDGSLERVVVPSLSPVRTFYVMFDSDLCAAMTVSPVAPRGIARLVSHETDDNRLVSFRNEKNTAPHPICARGLRAACSGTRSCAKTQRAEKSRGRVRSKG